MDVTVRNDGQISFPAHWHIRAEGLTIPELENELKKKIGRFIQDPQISVNPKEIQSQRVFIVGQVRKLYSNIGGKPYFQPESQGVLCLDALSDVEFYPEADLAASYVNRTDLVIPVDLKALMMDGDLSQNIPLLPEDRIVIPAALKRSHPSG